ncbi:purine nucleoside permease [Rhizosaccharibacter radicis]|uniref:Purine nucleoside permease n=1 Tax=Rhizosaccharibacter radicis TaxID=2782605 RepID=A0ABT1W0F8_9PROT|nr:purine nucleoside permease [Acetobacteraceae bacterium KSS12]
MTRRLPVLACFAVLAAASAGCAPQGPAASTSPSATSTPATPDTAASTAPIPIRVVVVTTFELGSDTGDRPGEFQRWVEKLPLREVLPNPAGYRPLRINRELGVLGIVTGEGPTRAAASITALGHDGRFDLSHAYVVLAGIAGIDPHFGSPGAAVWAPHVVDGDLAHEIDAREIPAGWSTGYLPLQRATPFEQPVPPADSISGTMVYTLDPGLVRWAYALTRDIRLPDPSGLAALRARYRGFGDGERPARVQMGDTLAAGTFWVGGRMNEWAENWVRYWTHDEGRFATTAEEDAGMMQALSFLAQARLVDLRRVLVLRTASNYDMPPPGQTPAALLASEANPGGGGYSGFMPAVDAAFDVGSVVVRELATHWDRYRDQVPASR